MDYYSKPQFRGGILLSEISAPANPASGTAVMYAGTDSYVYVKNDTPNTYGFLPPPQESRKTTNTTTGLTTSYGTFSGAPSVTTTVPASGVIGVRIGMVGTKGNTGTSEQLYIDVAFTGKSASDSSGSAVGMLGMAAATAGDLSVERETIFTGLTPGSLTIDLQARYVGGSTYNIHGCWLIVQVFP